MLTPRNPPELLDPDTIMTGICAVCKSVVEVPRWQCIKPKLNKFEQEPGVFYDLYCAECLTCKSMSLKNIGTRVYVVEKRVVK